MVDIMSIGYQTMYGVNNGGTQGNITIGRTIGSNLDGHDVTYQGSFNTFLGYIVGSSLRSGKTIT